MRVAIVTLIDVTLAASGTVAEDCRLDSRRWRVPDRLDVAVYTLTGLKIFTLD